MRLAVTQPSLSENHSSVRCFMSLEETYLFSPRYALVPVLPAFDLALRSALDLGQPAQARSGDCDNCGDLALYLTIRLFFD